MYDDLTENRANGLRAALAVRLRAEGEFWVWDPVQNARTRIALKRKNEVAPIASPSEETCRRLDEDHVEFGDEALGILVQQRWYEITAFDAIENAYLLAMLASVPDG